MVQWVVGSIFHGVNPLSYFSFQPVLHDWCNKGRGVCYPVCGMMHIKEPLLLIGKSSPCGGSGFPLSLSEWSFTICPTPYNHKYNLPIKMFISCIIACSWHHTISPLQGSSNVLFLCVQNWGLPIKILLTIN